MSEVLGIPIALGGGVLIALFVGDARLWLLWIARRLVRASARLLPGPHRTRYSEEWEANILALENAPFSALGLAILTSVRAPLWRLRLRRDPEDASSERVEAGVVAALDALVDAEPAVGRVWASTLSSLRLSVPESTYRLWLAPLRPIAISGQTLLLDAPSAIRPWVERRYLRLIEEALAASDSDLREVRFIDLPAAPVDSPRGLSPIYSFERFVVGPSNRLAHAAALAVAEAPAEAYNPLFIHGPPGIGKTHLLAAIANHLEATSPDHAVRYVTCEAFTNEFVEALRTSGADEFKRRYRDLDVLLVDDIQFLEGKRHTEEEFFHTFNALYQSGSQIVLSSDRSPDRIATLTERLRDRFEWGLTVAIEPLGSESQLVLLRRIFAEHNVRISEQLLTYLLKRLGSSTSVRSLNGAAIKIIAELTVSEGGLDRRLIDDCLPPRAR